MGQTLPTGTPQCLGPLQRNPPPRSNGDLQPRRPCKEQEKTTPPLTLPVWKDQGRHSQLAILHGLVVGPHKEGNCEQAAEPFRVRPMPGWLMRGRWGSFEVTVWR